MEVQMNWDTAPYTWTKFEFEHFNIVQPKINVMSIDELQFNHKMHRTQSNLPANRQSNQNDHTNLANVYSEHSIHCYHIRPYCICTPTMAA